MRVAAMKTDPERASSQLEPNKYSPPQTLLMSKGQFDYERLFLSVCAPPAMLYVFISPHPHMLSPMTRLDPVCTMISYARHLG